MKVKPRLYLLFLGLLSLVYIVITLVLPPDSRSLNKYNLSVGGAKALSLTIVLPYIAIWFTALWGSLKFRDYARSIKNSQDGKASISIAQGLLVLAFSMPVVAIINNLDLYFTHRSPGLLPAVTIINNYLTLVFTLWAFTLIYVGARQFKQLLGRYAQHLPEAESLPILFVVSSVAYAYFTLTNPARLHPTATAHTAAYYLADWPLLLTIIIPYIIVWYIGFSAVWFMHLYSVYVPGSLYKRAFAYVTNGVFLVIVSQMTLRFLTSMTAWFEAKKLKIVLLIIYLLLILIASGYVLIMKGSKRLAKIEDVI